MTQIQYDMKQGYTKTFNRRVQVEQLLVQTQCNATRLVAKSNKMVRKHMACQQILIFDKKTNEWIWEHDNLCFRQSIHAQGLF